MQLLARHPRADRRDHALVHLLAQPVVVRELVGDRADDERARHVGVEGRGDVARPDVDRDRLAPADRARAHVVSDARLGAVGDDEVVRDGAVLEERDGDGALQALRGERLAVQVQDPVDRLGAPEQLRGGACAGLGRALGPPDALHLRRGLRPAPLGEEPAIDVEPDAAGAQSVGELGREAGRDRGGVDAELGAGAGRDLEHRASRRRCPRPRARRARSPRAAARSSARPRSSGPPRASGRRRTGPRCARRRGRGRQQSAGTSIRSSGQRTVSP